MGDLIFGILKLGKVSFEMLKSWVNLVKYAMSFSILELGEVSFEMVDFESLCTAFYLMKSEIVFLFPEQCVLLYMVVPLRVQ